MESVIVSKDGLQIEDVLEKDGVYPSLTSGKSMRPLFKTHRDMVILEKCASLPKKYDVVLYRFGDKYILHRVIGIDKERSLFIIRGDNTFKKEYVPFSKILARLVSFTRKGKHGSIEDRSYKIYSRLWLFIYPVRYAVNFCCRAAKKIFRFVFGKKPRQST